MKTIRLTTAEAIVRFLIAQKTVIDGRTVPLFPGVFAIFGHGNVTSLGHALESVRDDLSTWRGQNEQSMALAATAYSKAVKRRQIMVATSSVGPGATNMVTAAGVAMANRLPLLLLAGDTFTSRVPDPVLQQVEHFGAPSTTVNDAFRAVTRYWDRITHPAQILQSLPNAVETMLDPAECGPAFIGLPQDVQAEAFDFPERFFAERVHQPRRQRADRSEIEAARLEARDREDDRAAGSGRAGAAHDQLDVLHLLVRELDGVEEGCSRDDRRAVLVVVKDRDRERFAQRRLDGKAVWGLDVLEVDATEGWSKHTHGGDEIVWVWCVKT